MRLKIGSGDDDVERAVAIRREPVAIADGEAIKRIGNEVTLAVIERDRPERAHRRQSVLGEMNQIIVGAVERLAVTIDRCCRINGVLR
jgi:hypothetical protein